MPSLLATLPPATDGSWAIAVFCFYILAVLALAWLSNRGLRSRSFMSEYFLGSRSLGMWAFALTFAATSASGGSFIGFPSLVYSHGWVVALWIGGYMMVPIVAMGLMGKRLNQIARRSEAITVPDVMRDRFGSPGLGALATALIVFFMIFNLVAQFKSGSIILQSLLQEEWLFQQASHWVGWSMSQVPGVSATDTQPGYLLCLIVFAAVVVIYTTYGGFRAVVWTDVMQGFVMLAGILVLLPLTLWAVGGLENATRELAEMTPPQRVSLRLSITPHPGEPSVGGTQTIPANCWLVHEQGDARRVFRTLGPCQFREGETVAKLPGSAQVTEIPAIELTYHKHVQQVVATPLDVPISVDVLATTPYKYGAGQPGVYVTGPGPDEHKIQGFLPISLGISFFFMWTFSTAGQPSNMVRLMAFDNSRTLRRAIFTVSMYYSLIYFPLVIVFCSARVLLPGWETEPDRIMPEMAKLTSALCGFPWLAGFLVAAPFAAVMSTMDSFLLMISSAVVRDLYQRNFNPGASEKTIKRLSYLTTLTVGTIAMIAAISPPKFLQDIIVFTGTGLATCFLVPVFLLLYWPRYNRAGAMSGLVAGFGTHVVLYLIGTLQHPKFSMTAYEPGGLHPLVWGIAVSLGAAIVVTLRTRAPDPALVQKYFGRPNPQPTVEPT